MDKSLIDWMQVLKLTWCSPLERRCMTLLLGLEKHSFHSLFVQRCYRETSLTIFGRVQTLACREHTNLTTSFILACHQVTHGIKVNKQQLIWSALGKVCHFNWLKWRLVLAKMRCQLNVLLFANKWGEITDLLQFEVSKSVYFAYPAVRTESITSATKEIFTFTL